MKARKETAGGSHWQPPPHFMIGGAESILGLQIIEERPDELGMTLWRTLRSVVLWTESRPERRSELLGQDALEGVAGKGLALADPPLGEALKELLGVLSMGSEETEVATACRALSERAAEAGRPVASLYFMEMAATVAACNPEPAFLAGRSSRARAEYARAEGWFKEAIFRARATRDRTNYVRALTGLGNLHLQRGNFPRAREFHLRAYRVAKRYRLRERQAMASHDLFVVFDLTEDPQKAEWYANEASYLYGAAHPRFPSLANDVAVFWIGRGHFGRALPVLEALLPHFASRRDTLITLGNIARAAGAVGRAEPFDRARRQIEELINVSDAFDAAAGVLLDLARGAASLGRWELAEDVAYRCIQLAEVRKQGQILLTAEGVAEVIASRRRIDDARASDVSLSNASDPLGTRLFVALQGADA